MCSCSTLPTLHFPPLFHSFFVDSWKVLTCHRGTVGCQSQCDTGEPEQPAARTRHQSPTDTHTLALTHTCRYWDVLLTSLWGTRRGHCEASAEQLHTQRGRRRRRRRCFPAVSTINLLRVCARLPDKLPSYVSVKPTELLRMPPASLLKLHFSARCCFFFFLLAKHISSPPPPALSKDGHISASAGRKNKKLFPPVSSHSSTDTDRYTHAVGKYETEMSAHVQECPNKLKWRVGRENLDANSAPVLLKTSIKTDLQV